MGGLDETLEDMVARDARLQFILSPQAEEHVVRSSYDLSNMSPVQAASTTSGPPWNAAASAAATGRSASTDAPMTPVGPATAEPGGVTPEQHHQYAAQATPVVTPSAAVAGVRAAAATPVQQHGTVRKLGLGSRIARPAGLPASSTPVAQQHAPAAAPAAASASTPVPPLRSLAQGRAQPTPAGTSGHAHGASANTTPRAVAGAAPQQVTPRTARQKLAGAMGAIGGIMTGGRGTPKGAAGSTAAAAPSSSGVARSAATGSGGAPSTSAAPALPSSVRKRPPAGALESHSPAPARKLATASGASAAAPSTVAASSHSHAAAGSAPFRQSRTTSAATPSKALGKPPHHPSAPLSAASAGVAAARGATAQHAAPGPTAAPVAPAAAEVSELDVQVSQPSLTLPSLGGADLLISESLEALVANDPALQSWLSATKTSVGAAAAGHNGAATSRSPALGRTSTELLQPLEEVMAEGFGNSSLLDGDADVEMDLLLMADGFSGGAATASAGVDAAPYQPDGSPVRARVAAEGVPSAATPAAEQGGMSAASTPLIAQLNGWETQRQHTARGLEGAAGMTPEPTASPAGMPRQSMASKVRELLGLDEEVPSAGPSSGLFGPPLTSDELWRNIAAEANSVFQQHAGAGAQISTPGAAAALAASPTGLTDDAPAASPTGLTDTAATSPAGSAAPAISASSPTGPSSPPAMPARVDEEATSLTTPAKTQSAVEAQQPGSSAFVAMGDSAAFVAAAGLEAVAGAGVPYAADAESETGELSLAPSLSAALTKAMSMQKGPISHAVAISEFSSAVTTPACRTALHTAEHTAEHEPLEGVEEDDESALELLAAEAAAAAEAVVAGGATPAGRLAEVGEVPEERQLMHQDSSASSVGFDAAIAFEAELTSRRLAGGSAFFGAGSSGGGSTVAPGSFRAAAGSMYEAVQEEDESELKSPVAARATGQLTAATAGAEAADGVSDAAVHGNGATAGVEPQVPTQPLPEEAVGASAPAEVETASAVVSAAEAAPEAGVLERSVPMDTDFAEGLQAVESFVVDTAPIAADEGDAQPLATAASAATDVTASLAAAAGRSAVESASCASIAAEPAITSGPVEFAAQLEIGAMADAMEVDQAPDPAGALAAAPQSSAAATGAEAAMPVGAAEASPHVNVEGWATAASGAECADAMESEPAASDVPAAPAQAEDMDTGESAEQADAAVAAISEDAAAGVHTELTLAARAPTAMHAEAETAVQSEPLAAEAHAEAAMAAEVSPATHADMETAVRAGATAAEGHAEATAAVPAVGLAAATGAEDSVGAGAMEVESPAVAVSPAATEAGAQPAADMEVDAATETAEQRDTDGASTATAEAEASGVGAAPGSPAEAPAPAVDAPAAIPHAEGLQAVGLAAAKMAFSMEPATAADEAAEPAMVPSERAVSGWAATVTGPERATAHTPEVDVTPTVAAAVADGLIGSAVPELPVLSPAASVAGAHAADDITAKRSFTPDAHVVSGGAIEAVDAPDALGSGPAEGQAEGSTDTLAADEAVPHMAEVDIPTAMEAEEALQVPAAAEAALEESGGAAMGVAAAVAREAPEATVATAVEEVEVEIVDSAAAATAVPTVVDAPAVVDGPAATEAGDVAAIPSEAAASAVGPNWAELTEPEVRVTEGGEEAPVMGAQAATEVSALGPAPDASAEAAAAAPLISEVGVGASVTEGLAATVSEAEAEAMSEALTAEASVIAEDPAPASGTEAEELPATAEAELQLADEASVVPVEVTAASQANASPKATTASTGVAVDMAAEAPIAQHPAGSGCVEESAAPPDAMGVEAVTVEASAEAAVPEAAEAADPEAFVAAAPTATDAEAPATAYPAAMEAEAFAATAPAMGANAATVAPAPETAEVEAITAALPPPELDAATPVAEVAAAAYEAADSTTLEACLPAADALGGTPDGPSIMPSAPQEASEGAVVPESMPDGSDAPVDEPMYDAEEAGFEVASSVEDASQGASEHAAPADLDASMDAPSTEAAADVAAVGAEALATPEAAADSPCTMDADSEAAQGAARDVPDDVDGARPSAAEAGGADTIMQNADAMPGAAALAPGAGDAGPASSAEPAADVSVPDAHVARELPHKAPAGASAAVVAAAASTGPAAVDAPAAAPISQAAGTSAASAAFDHDMHPQLPQPAAPVGDVESSARKRARLAPAGPVAEGMEGEITSGSTSAEATQELLHDEEAGDAEAGPAVEDAGTRAPRAAPSDGAEEPGASVALVPEARLASDASAASHVSAFAAPGAHAAATYAASSVQEGLAATGEGPGISELLPSDLFSLMIDETGSHVILSAGTPEPVPPRSAEDPPEPQEPVAAVGAGTGAVDESPAAARTADVTDGEALTAHGPIAEDHAHGDITSSAADAADPGSATTPAPAPIILGKTPGAASGEPSAAGAPCGAQPATAEAPAPVSTALSPHTPRAPASPLPEPPSVAAAPAAAAPGPGGDIVAGQQPLLHAWQVLAPPAGSMGANGGGDAASATPARMLMGSSMRSLWSNGSRLSRMSSHRDVDDPQVLGWQGLRQSASEMGSPWTAAAATAADRVVEAAAPEEPHAVAFDSMGTGSDAASAPAGSALATLSIEGIPESRCMKSAAAAGEPPAPELAVHDPAPATPTAAPTANAPASAQPAASSARSSASGSLSDAGELVPAWKVAAPLPDSGAEQILPAGAAGMPLGRRPSLRNPAPASLQGNSRLQRGTSRNIVDDMDIDKEEEAVDLQPAPVSAPGRVSAGSAGAAAALATVPAVLGDIPEASRYDSEDEGPLLPAWKVHGAASPIPDSPEAVAAARSAPLGAQPSYRSSRRASSRLHRASAPDAEDFSFVDSVMEGHAQAAQLQHQSPQTHLAGAAGSPAGAVAGARGGLRRSRSRTLPGTGSGAESAACPAAAGAHSGGSPGTPSSGPHSDSGTRANRVAERVSSRRANADSLGTVPLPRRSFCSMGDPNVDALRPAWQVLPLALAGSGSNATSLGAVDSVGGAAGGGSSAGAPSAANMLACARSSSRLSRMSSGIPEELLAELRLQAHAAVGHLQGMPGGDESGRAVDVLSSVEESPPEPAVPSASGDGAGGTVHAWKVLASRVPAPSHAGAAPEHAGLGAPAVAPLGLPRPMGLGSRPILAATRAGNQSSRLAAVSSKAPQVSFDPEPVVRNLDPVVQEEDVEAAPEPVVEAEAVPAAPQATVHSVDEDEAVVHAWKLVSPAAPSAPAASGTAGVGVSPMEGAATGPSAPRSTPAPLGRRPSLRASRSSSQQGSRLSRSSVAGEDYVDDAYTTAPAGSASGPMEGTSSADHAEDAAVAPDYAAARYRGSDDGKEADSFLPQSERASAPAAAMAGVPPGVLYASRGSGTVSEYGSASSSARQLVRNNTTGSLSGLTALVAEGGIPGEATIARVLASRHSLRARSSSSSRLSRVSSARDAAPIDLDGIREEDAEGGQAPLPQEEPEGQQQQQPQVGSRSGSERSSPVSRAAAAGARSPQARLSGSGATGGLSLHVNVPAGPAADVEQPLQAWKVLAGQGAAAADGSGDSPPAGSGEAPGSKLSTPGSARRSFRSNSSRLSRMASAVSESGLAGIVEEAAEGAVAPTSHSEDGTPGRSGEHAQNALRHSPSGRMPPPAPSANAARMLGSPVLLPARSPGSPPSPTSPEAGGPTAAAALPPPGGDADETPLLPAWKVLVPAVPPAQSAGDGAAPGGAAAAAAPAADGAAERVAYVGTPGTTRQPMLKQRSSNLSGNSRLKRVTSGIEDAAAQPLPAQPGADPTAVSDAAAAPAAGPSADSPTEAAAPGAAAQPPSACLASGPDSTERAGSHSTGTPSAGPPSAGPPSAGPLSAGSGALQAGQPVAPQTLQGAESSTTTQDYSCITFANMPSARFDRGSSSTAPTAPAIRVGSGGFSSFSRQAGAASAEPASGSVPAVPKAGEAIKEEEVLPSPATPGSPASARQASPAATGSQAGSGAAASPPRGTSPRGDEAPLVGARQEGSREGKRASGGGKGLFACFSCMRRPSVVE